MDVMKKLQELRLIPVVTIENSENAIPLGQALIEAGLPIIEITFRTLAAEQSISVLSKNMSHIFVGAGIVLTIEQIKKAVNAGAQFIVTPVLIQKLLTIA